MSKRDWAKDWELCRRATPGAWYVMPWKDGGRMVYAPCEELIFVAHCYKHPLDLGLTPNDPQANAEFIAEAREALPYWLQQG